MRWQDHAKPYNTTKATAESGNTFITNNVFAGGAGIDSGLSSTGCGALARGGGGAGTGGSGGNGGHSGDGKTKAANGIPGVARTAGCFGNSRYCGIERFSRKTKL